MSDDVILAKAQSLERCVRRAREELAASANFAVDLTRQDAAILNVQRACEATIDMAFRLVRLKGLGAPANTREAFDQLTRAGLIDNALGEALMKMVGFKNVAVHQYIDLDITVVESVIRFGLDDLLTFSSVALRRSPNAG